MRFGQMSRQSQADPHTLLAMLVRAAIEQLKDLLAFPGVDTQPGICYLHDQIVRSFPALCFNRKPYLPPCRRVLVSVVEKITQNLVQALRVSADGRYLPGQITVKLTTGSAGGLR
jgi:hypothetical protein